MGVDRIRSRAIVLPVNANVIEPVNTSCWCTAHSAEARGVVMEIIASNKLQSSAVVRLHVDAIQIARLFRLIGIGLEGCWAAPGWEVVRTIVTESHGGEAGMGIV